MNLVHDAWRPPVFPARWSSLVLVLLVLTDLSIYGRCLRHSAHGPHLSVEAYGVSLDGAIFRMSPFNDAIGNFSLTGLPPMNKFAANGLLDISLPSKVQGLTSHHTQDHASIATEIGFAPSVPPSQSTFTGTGSERPQVQEERVKQTSFVGLAQQLSHQTNLGGQFLMVLVVGAAGLCFCVCVRCVMEPTTLTERHQQQKHQHSKKPHLHVSSKDSRHAKPVGALSATSSASHDNASGHAKHKNQLNIKAAAMQSTSFASSVSEADSSESEGSSRRKQPPSKSKNCREHQATNADPHHNTQHEKPNEDAKKRFQDDASPAQHSSIPKSPGSAEHRGGHSDNEHAGDSFIKKLVDKGKTTRGKDNEDKYKFGDFTRGLVSKIRH